MHGVGILATIAVFLLVQTEGKKKYCDTNYGNQRDMVCFLRKRVKTLEARFNKLVSYHEQQGKFNPREWKCFRFDEKHVPRLQKARRLSYQEARKQMCEGGRTDNYHYTEGRNKFHRGCNSCDCCVRRKHAWTPWRCHHYTTKQRKQLAEWDSDRKFSFDMRRNMVCTNRYTGRRDPTFVYTKGRNQNYPGCGLCHCCKENKKI